MVSDDPKWTKFVEDLNKVDKQVADCFKNKVDQAEFECEITDITTTKTIEKIL